MRAHFLPILLALAGPALGADTDPYGLFIAERLEYQSAHSATVWEAQGYYGGDYRKFWWKTEGDVADERIEDASVDLLFSRAWTAFFDWQAGVRFDEHEGNRRSALALGVQGLAPYRFEVDTALFIDEGGTLRFRGEFERDLLLSQRWVLQPRAELTAASSEIREIAVFQGLNELDLELRLRYEFRREFAAYIGLSWQQTFGDARTALRAAGEDASQATFVVGLRLWF